MRCCIESLAFQSADAMVITDAAGVIVRINRAYSEITGYSADEAIGKRPGELVNSGRQNPEFYRQMWVQLQHDGHWSGELWNRRKNGELYPEFLSITAVADEPDHTAYYVGIFHDISLRKRNEARIEHLAFYDPLTDLPNRRLFLDRLQLARRLSLRDQVWNALCFIDLDNFKPLNDAFGHGYGDQLLVDVAHRLQGCVRDADTVARLGGDEFIVMLQNLGSDRHAAQRHAAMVATKINEQIALPYQLQDQRWQLSCSIGVTLFCGTPLTEDALLQHADAAMYQAKKAGKNTLRFFNNENDSDTLTAT